MEFSNITSYRSGVGNVSDLQGYMLAGVPVGLPVVQVAGGRFVYLPKNIEREIICYSHSHRVFIDSGMFSVFQKSLATGIQVNLDFDNIMRHYLYYAFFGNFALVILSDGSGVNIRFCDECLKELKRRTK